MKTEEFENATEKGLRSKANECFEKLNDSGSHERPALLLEAKFYLDEIERRKQDRVARRDLLLELIVIVLIGLELYFGIAGGNQQLAALQKLDVSTSHTAEALTMLASTLHAGTATPPSKTATTAESQAATPARIRPRPKKESKKTTGTGDKEVAR
jgi:hypothetical protein